jgi:hypothetical protein
MQDTILCRRYGTTGRKGKMGMHNRSENRHMERLIYAPTPLSLYICDCKWMRKDVKGSYSLFKDVWAFSWWDWWKPQSEISCSWAASMKRNVFWDVALHSLLEIDWHFRGAYCLYYWALMDGGNRTLWNVNLYNYLVQHPRRQSSSKNHQVCQQW